MLILEKNPNKKIWAECTLIVIDDSVKVILRDSGVIFDLTDEDAAVSSIRQYVVSNMLVVPDHKAYITTTGYNRNELLLK